MEKKCSVIEALQSKEQEMLVKLAEILKQNEIPFFLACGSMLGCVRHSGFIPWDDDVDIYIYGKDYKKLREILLNRNDASLEIHDYSTKKNYPYWFPKVVAKNTLLEEENVQYREYTCGVYIDIFLLSEVSSNKVVRFFQEKRRYINYVMLRAYYLEYKGYRKIFSDLAHLLVNPDNVQKRLMKGYERSIKKSKLVVDIGGFGKTCLLQGNIFEESRMLPFNEAFMPVPRDYDRYLEHYYGEYMKLPPMNQRTSGHKIKRLIIDGEVII